MNKTPNLVLTLIAINLVIFFFPGDVGRWLNHVIALYFPEHNNFRIWQLVSYMFAHGGISHLMLNMYTLYVFGSVLENIWGGRKFLAYYLLTGFGGAVLYTLVNNYNFTNIVNELYAAGISTAEYRGMLSASQFRPQS
ncbi:rhomboid family intramembrane serine protease [Vibrio variabilis]|uniref:rhomboid family intramembrane serine protease n=1 Tax=Vibrio variabilis TaxID=990271 RepID=UPI000DD74608|nr:rhomboid family intramembrane serine protease [Vibrio variabilis]